MKAIQHCENIIDVRNNIDSIDKNIIKLLAERAEYVKIASNFKKSISDVQASDRVLNMMVDRKNWAIANNVDPVFVEKLFKLIVKFFIRNEIEEWEIDNDKSINIDICDATEDDIESIYYLQKRAFVQEAEKQNVNYSIVPIIQTMEQFRNEFKKFVYLKAVKGKKVVGSARAISKDGVCHIGRVIVEPVFQGNGYGSLLMNAIEEQFPNIKTFELFTGERSVENVTFYQKNGYTIEDRNTDETGVSMVIMRKRC
jgi:chorismate mutase/GNAT superfamily N-acetyltransferase